jgi:hypothetical protein
MYFYFFRIRGVTFDESLTRALEPRRDTPDFGPNILPGSPTDEPRREG